MYSITSAFPSISNHVLKNIIALDCWGDIHIIVHELSESNNSVSGGSIKWLEELSHDLSSWFGAHNILRVWLNVVIIFKVINCHHLSSTCIETSVGHFDNMSSGFVEGSLSQDVEDFIYGKLSRSWWVEVLQKLRAFILGQFNTESSKAVFELHWFHKSILVVVQASKSNS